MARQPGDPPVAVGTQVQLFADTNTNGQFDVGPDLLIGTDLTDATGGYRFDGLTVGTYFLVQEAIPGAEYAAADRGPSHQRHGVADSAD